MSKKLLPCPFCGGKPLFQVHRIAEDAEVAFVSCQRCGTQTEHYEDAYAPRGEAIAAWNKRAPIGAERNLCAKIFDHKWLDPECVETGCQSLLPRRLAEEIAVMEPPAEAHSSAWLLGFCRARKMAAAHILADAIERGEHLEAPSHE